MLTALVAISVSPLTPASASAATVQTTSFPIAPAMRARAAALGPDGNLWFVAIGGGGEIRESIDRVTPTGQLTEFPLPVRHYEANTGPAIVAGADGNLWFAEYGTNKIGRITPTGEITEFALPYADNRPGSIASGPEGGIWFTEEAVDKIGRISGSKITEFPVPGSGPAEIAPGAEGDLWFTEKTANKIGRITPSGSIAEFAVPTPGSLPRSIALGPDGNLWFSEENVNQVGRITPAGEVTEFPVTGEVLGSPPASREIEEVVNGTEEIGTEEIVAGPYGDIWFSSGTYIGSITPSGQTADPACLEPSCRLPVASLTEGPEGGLWFGGGVRITEGGGGNALLELNQPGLVGRFVPAAPSIAVGPKAHRVARRRTDLRLSCKGAVAGERCLGALRLVKRFHVRRSKRRRRMVVAQSRYDLLTGESARVPLTLRRKAMRLFSRHGSLRVRATITTHGQVEDSRWVVLHRRRPARKKGHRRRHKRSVSRPTPGR
jgi:streptogramin lyase